MRWKLNEGEVLLMHVKIALNSVNDQCRGSCSNLEKIVPRSGLDA